jgi:LysR family transcriptional regulator of abg operon
MNLNPMRVFLAIVDTGSQRAAARSLGLTQPAVTKALQKLESELDVRLFDRSVHGAILTDFGQTFLSHARLIDAELKTCIEALDQIKGGRKGSISFALSHLPGTLLLPNVLQTFRRKWPDISLRVSASTYPYLLAGLRDGSLDFAIVPAPKEGWPEDLMREPLMLTTLAPITRRNHPMASARRLKDLAGAEWILPTQESATAQTLYRAAEHAAMARPLCQLTCETLTGMIMTVASSDLIGLVPSEMVQSLAALGGIVELPIEETLESAELCLIRRKVSMPSPAVSALTMMFSKAAQSLTRQAVRRGDNQKE